MLSCYRRVVYVITVAGKIILYFWWLEPRKTENLVTTVFYYMHNFIKINVALLWVVSWVNCRDWFFFRNRNIFSIYWVFQTFIQPTFWCLVSKFVSPPCKTWLNFCMKSSCSMIYHVEIADQLLLHNYFSEKDFVLKCTSCYNEITNMTELPYIFTYVNKDMYHIGNIEPNATHVFIKWT